MPEPTVEEHTKQSALALYDECVSTMRDVSSKLESAQSHHPVASFLKRAIDKALQYAPDLHQPKG